MDMENFDSRTGLVVTEDNFDEIFEPQQNHLDDNASFNGWMYETYDEEFDYVKSQDPQNVWTIIEGDEGMYYVNGIHLVNRLGYFVCKHKWTDSMDIKLDEDF